MPRFYFHLLDDLDAKDPEGQELADIFAAHGFAIANVRSIAAENILKGKLDLSHAIQIEDDAGDVVGTVTFGDAIEVTL